MSFPRQYRSLVNECSKSLGECALGSRATHSPSTPNGPFLLQVLRASSNLRSAWVKTRLLDVISYDVGTLARFTMRAVISRESDAQPDVFDDSPPAKPDDAIKNAGARLTERQSVEVLLLEESLPLPGDGGENAQAAGVVCEQRHRPQDHDQDFGEQSVPYHSHSEWTSRLRGIGGQEVANSRW